MWNYIERLVCVLFSRPTPHEEQLVGILEILNNRLATANESLEVALRRRPVAVTPRPIERTSLHMTVPPVR